jgi:AraC-like DNA-binding protein
MLFLKHVPKPPISEFVEYLWLVSDAPPHARERILPAGTLELVINLHEDQIRIYDDTGTCRRFSGAIVSGAYSHPFVIDTAEHALTMGVHFRPGGAMPFTRVAPGELADSHVDVELLWGSGATELRERLFSASTRRKRFEILESALHTAMADRRGRASVQFGLQRLQQPQASVREIVASLGVSHRHFASLFREEVGMTPKLFFRVQRFQRAVALAQGPSITSWAALASECGYYDQAHLIQDFAAFAGSTPGEYLRQRSDHVKDHHVALA